MHVAGHSPGVDVERIVREDTEDLELHLGRALTGGGNLNRLQYTAEGLAAYSLHGGRDQALERLFR